jgi:16S rRNA G966 N2-methylase RsmD
MMKLATGIPKTQQKNPKTPLPTSEFAPGVSLYYEGKRAEQDILATDPISTKKLWQGEFEQKNVQTPNLLFYEDNLPILASLLQEPSIRGNVRLIYIDPPFATNSIFQSRSQGDAYGDLLIGAHYIEFLRERLILLRELLAKDGSIYVHLDENNEGDLVLDCFSGSGTTLAVASQLNRRWIGIDNSTEAIATILRRFAKGLEPMGDFVTKPESSSQEKQVQDVSLWSGSEGQVKFRKPVSKKTWRSITDFILYTSETCSKDLVDVLSQWLKWNEEGADEEQLTLP